MRSGSTVCEMLVDAEFTASVCGVGDCMVEKSCAASFSDQLLCSCLTDIDSGSI